MDKRPEAMTDQERLLELQMKAAPQSRIVDLLTVITLCAALFGFGIAMYVLPDKDFSEQENRYLQTFPELTLKTVTSGKFTEQIGDYYADQFPLRNAFVGLKGAAEIAMLKQQNDNVTAGRDGYIVKRNGYTDYEMLDKNAKAINDFAAVTQAQGIPYVVALAGRGEDVLQSYLPSLYPTDISDDTWSYADAAFSGTAGLTWLDLRAPFLEAISADAASGSAEQLYYRTDHHWTTAGAFKAYGLVAGTLGVTSPLTSSDVTAETVSDAFYGTTWSSGGMKWIKPDAMQYYRWSGDEDYVTEITDTGEKLTGFYDRTYLDKKDKYSSFIGGNNARVNIYRADGTARPKLLVIKDSFAHSVAPFLAHDYDLVIIDLRYYKESVKKLVEDEGISAVLVLSNIDSLISSNTFGLLEMGLSQ